MTARAGRLPAATTVENRPFKTPRDMMTCMTVIVPPERRRCVRCGRVDVWDGGKETWVAAVEDGTRQTGKPHCLHEWDISGNYSPVRNDA